MTKRPIPLLTAVFIACALINVPAEEPAEAPSVQSLEPQIQPMASWLMALKNEDVAQFKAAYSPETRKAIEDRGLTWEEALGKARAFATKDIGTDYTLRDFSFSFDGDETSGKVKTAYKDRDLGVMRVRKIGDEWKLNEI